MEPRVVGKARLAAHGPAAGLPTRLAIFTSFPCKGEACGAGSQTETGRPAGWSEDTCATPAGAIGVAAGASGAQPHGLSPLGRSWVQGPT